MNRYRKFLALPALLLVAFGAIGCARESGKGGSNKAASTGELTGVFKIEAAECAGGAVTKGSFFRMVQPNGKTDQGPFVPNGDSACGDKTYTPLLPGQDGGLSTASFQPNPEPAFDSTGNGVAAALTQPQTWFAVKFSLSTNKKDPQSGLEVAAPALTVEGGSLKGDLRALSAAWNGQYFNQGAPKPDGSLPGNTAAPTGTYDPSTKRYKIDWSSQIVGGPFNNFTGVWHLEGVFQPS